MILFGEEGFFLDNEAARAPPPQADYRIRDIDSDDDNISTVEEKSGTSISFYEATSSDLTCSAASKHQDTDNTNHDNDKDSISMDSFTTNSSGTQVICACWL